MHHFYKYRKLIPILLFFYNLRQYQSFKNLGSQQGKGKYTYRRNHEDNYLCTEAEIRRMFADANHHRDSNVRWTHRIYLDRMWEANLYHFYIKVYNRLIQVLPHPIMIKDGIQQEETPAHDAIREALINCIIRHYRIFCVNGNRIHL